MNWMTFDIHRNGHFDCETKNFAAGTNCIYKCSAGWIPGKEAVMTCNEKMNRNDEVVAYNWDKDEDRFICVKSIRYVNTFITFFWINKAWLRLHY